MQGKPASDFSPACTGGTTFQVSALRGASVVLHFYPKDNTRFPFELLADPDEAVCGQLVVVKEKPKYGKKACGIPPGWRGVKVSGHAQEVLNFAKAL